MSGSAPDPAAAPHYDVFISYSRKDVAFARALERALRRYRPPRGTDLPRARLGVFRDESDLTGTEYFAAIERQLGRARKLVLVGSPSAARSRFVDDEIRRFAAGHRVDDVIAILLAGVPNNEARPTEEALQAFPPALLELQRLPLAVDYRGFGGAFARIDGGRHLSAWTKLIADIYGRSRAEIEQRERRRRRGQWLVRGGAGAAIAAMLAGALIVTRMESQRAESQTRQAEANARDAAARRFAAHAMDAVEKDPELATLLALEAARRAPVEAAQSALRVALARLPDRLIAIAPADSLDAAAALALSPDGRRLALADGGKRLRLVDLASGVDVVPFPAADQSLTGARFSPDGTWLAATTRDEPMTSAIHDAATGAVVARVAGELFWQPRAENGVVAAVAMREREIALIEFDRQGGARELRRVAPRGYHRRNVWERDHVLSPDATRIAVLESRPAARLSVTDLRSGRTIIRQLEAPLALSSLAWSADGAQLAVHGLFGFAVLEGPGLAPGLVFDSGTEKSVEDLAFAPGSGRLATTDVGGVTTLWDTKSRRKVASLAGLQTRAYRPGFAPSGDVMSVVYGDGRAELWDLHHMRAAAAFEGVWGEIIGAQPLGDDATLALQFAQGRLSFWSLERWRPRHRVAFDDRRSDELRLSADGVRIGWLDGGVWRGWNVESGAVDTSSAAAPVPVSEVARRQIGDRVLRIEGRDAAIADAKTGRRLQRLPHADDVRGGAFDAAGRCVVTASGYRMASGSAPAAGDAARLWDAESGALLREWRLGPFGADAAFFAGAEHVVVVHHREISVFRTSLCAPLADLVAQAERKVARQLSPEERARFEAVMPDRALP